MEGERQWISIGIDYQDLLWELYRIRYSLI